MTTIALELRMALFTAIGALLGVAHFTALRHTARLYLDRRRRAQAVALHALRLTAAVGAWYAIARFDAIALISAAAGLWLGRGAVLGRSWSVS